MKSVVEILSEASILMRGAKSEKIPRFIRHQFKKTTGISLAKYRKPQIRTSKRVYHDEHGRVIDKARWEEGRERRAHMRRNQIHQHRYRWQARIKEPKLIG